MKVIKFALLLFVICIPTNIYAEDFLTEYFEYQPSPKKPASISGRTQPAKNQYANSPKSLSAEHKQMQIRKVETKPVNKSLVIHNTQSPPSKPKSLDKPTVFEIRKNIVPPQKLATSPAVKALADFSNLTIKGPYGNPIPKKPSFSAELVTLVKPVIVIDPGHGGKDPGATGKLGTREKNVTLLYALALKKALDRTGKYKVILTRYDDRFIELRNRVSIARRGGGDVLISIHADSNPDKNTRGFSLYTLSNGRAHSEAQDLLRKSEKEEVIRGAFLRGESIDVKEAIIDFAQESTRDVSNDFARTIGRHLGKRIQSLNKHQREGSLAVLTGADIPSVLIELGYLSNLSEEKLLQTDEHKEKIVNSLVNAINEYFTKFNIVF